MVGFFLGGGDGGVNQVFSVVLEVVSLKMYS